LLSSAEVDTAAAAVVDDNIIFALDEEAELLVVLILTEVVGVTKGLSHLAQTDRDR
jgi:hypothetical protein